MKPAAAQPEDWSDRELLIVRELARLIGRSLEPAFAIREALHLMSELLGLNRGRVLLPETEGGRIVIRHSYGLTQQEAARGAFARGEGVTGRVWATGETAIVQDIDDEPRYLARTVRREQLPQEVVSYLALPITIDGEVAGVLAVHRLRRRDRALADDLRILQIVAALIAQVLRINKMMAARTASLESENRALKSALSRRVASWGIVGESLALQQALGQLEQVAGTDASVLLVGESGTGKELFARALHLSSGRREGPFVRVNCGAIPESLFESELFGHEKGAFTGAAQLRIGRFEQAHGGTLFLDEVGDLPLAMQVKLLRVLQEQTVVRVGGNREIAVDVRIVAATNQSLQHLVAQGRFRLDLFYRLNVIPIRLPALRERRGDIGLLARHYLNQVNQSYQRDVGITPDAVERLAAWDWPGNVRQLRNVIERLALLAAGALIGADDVAAVLMAEQAEGERGDPSAGMAMPPGVGSTGPVGAAAGTWPGGAAVSGMGSGGAGGWASPGTSPVTAGVAAAPGVPPWNAGSPHPGAPWSGASAIRDYRPVSGDERARIVEALQATGGNKTRAAQRIGLTLRQLNYRIKVLGVSAK